jgi:hypothetical protein
MAALTTEDADTATMLADLIEKSKDVRGVAPMPTPTSALLVATQALARNGIYPPAPQGPYGERLLLVSHEDYPLLFRQALHATAHIALPGTPWRLVRAICDEPHSPQPIAKNDLCCLLLPPDGEDAPERLTDFFTRLEIQKLMHDITPVCRGKYLEALVSRANGYDIDLSALPGLADLPPEQAAAQLPRGYLLYADQASTRYIMEQATAYGLTMTAFARVTDTNLLSFSTHGTQEFSFSAPQLRHLMVPRIIELRMADRPSLKEEHPPVGITHQGLDTIATVTLPLTANLTPHDITQVFTSALCALGDHGSHHGIYAAIGLSESTTTPPSVLWSAILGVHCALCENNIPALPPVWHSANTGDEIITLCLIARTPATLPSQDAPTIMKEEKNTAEVDTVSPKQAENP